MQFSFAFEEMPQIAIVRDRLLAAQGQVRDPLRHGPEDQLFKAIISSRTRDAVSQRAFQSLKLRFRSWEDLARAKFEDVLACIAEVTHAKDRAVQLMETAKSVIAERGSFKLDFLLGWNVEDASNWLQGLQSVGPKCAAATLNFSSLRMRDFAVDTHVMRVSKRLGLIPEKATDAKAHRLLLGLMPDRWDADDLYELHWLMKAQGQTVCTHNSPRCADCVLQDLCATCRTKGKRIH